MAARKRRRRLDWTVSADMARFEEALEYWRSLRVVTEAQLEAMEERARARTWTLAGVVQLNVLRDVFAALDQAIEKGQTLEEFKERIGPVLSEKRAELAFRNGVQKAYNAGRWEQLKDPEVRRVRPYLMFDAILDSRTSPICTTRNRTIKPADDPYWVTNNPPLHHRCRSSLRSLTEAQATRHGGITDDTHEQPEVSPGFGLAPDVELPWQPNPGGYPVGLWEEWIAKQRLWGTPERPQWGSGLRRFDSLPPWHMDGIRRPVRPVQGAFEHDKERRTAEYLAQSGNDVVGLHRPGAKSGPGRRADSEVNGRKVEFKKLGVVDDYSKRITNDVQNSLRRGGQAPSVVVDGRDTAMRVADATRAARRIEGLRAQGIHPYERLDYLRVIGDDFDLTWTF
ncbi:MAG: minor capsid protein [Polyangiaceae bacterium]|nr:minor capsid protein [Polyangiaceae bacterium]